MKDRCDRADGVSFLGVGGTGLASGAQQKMSDWQIGGHAAQTQMLCAQCTEVCVVPAS